MTDFKGRHLGFLILLCAGWSAARLAIGWSGDNAMAVQRTNPVASDPASSTPTVAPAPLLSRTDASLPCCSHIRGADVFTPPNAMRQAEGVAKAKRAISVSSQTGRISLGPDPATLLTDSGGMAPFPIFPFPTSPFPDRQGQPQPAVPLSSVFGFYGYSFWRWPREHQPLAVAGQYGGGQSGFVATIALQRGDPAHLALVIRTAVAHENVKERELTLGGRWRPFRSLPILITAERRLRHARGDAFGLYASGGAGPVALPLAFKLETYAQAGIVSGADAGPFFDGFARADRQVVQSKRLSLHLGTTIWAGGQRDVMRIDAGPSLRADVGLGTAKLRVAADWRFRIAGSAQPGSGPAITLSTGF